MATAHKNPSFATASFISRDDMAKRLVCRALEVAPRCARLKMLDLGCGTGASAIEAARLLPNLHAVALDIAAANVAKVRTKADAAGVGERVETVCADYLSWGGGQFDLIVSDSVLYIIPGKDEVLAARLAADLVSGGVLVITTPIESLGNRIRIALRHLWRALPLAIDKLPLLIARRLYPGVTLEALVDRVRYLRVIPVRLYGAAFANALRREGIEKILDEPWERVSVAKLTHRLVVLRRLARPDDT